MPESHVQGRGSLSVARVHVHSAAEEHPQSSQLVPLGEHVQQGVAALQDGRAQLLHVLRVRLVEDVGNLATDFGRSFH